MIEEWMQKHRLDVYVVTDILLRQICKYHLKEIGYGKESKETN